MADRRNARRATDTTVPAYHQLIWPTLQALEQLGGSGTIQEIEQKVAELEHFTESQMEVPRGRGNMTLISYRQYWSRHYLHVVSAIERSRRGVWAITEIGRRMTEADAQRVPAEVRRRMRLKGTPQQGQTVENEAAEIAREYAEEPPDLNEQLRLGLADTSEVMPDAGWKTKLLDAMRSMRPDAFERLCQRVLREKGFENPIVTGRAGDNGIDGTAILRVGLLSYHIIFQCKRITGSISPNIVREFRGAMTSMTDRGLIITTGTFTPAAKNEAAKFGAPIVTLIDGDELCAIMKELELGVKTYVVEQVKVDTEWFATL